jgi:hypothetical protein
MRGLGAELLAAVENSDAEALARIRSEAERHVLAQDRAFAVAARLWDGDSLTGTTDAGPGPARGASAARG